MDENKISDKVLNDLKEEVSNLKDNSKIPYMNAFYEGFAYGQRITAKKILKDFAILNNKMSNKLRKTVFEEVYQYLQYLSNISKDQIEKIFKEI